MELHQHLAGSNGTSGKSTILQEQSCVEFFLNIAARLLAPVGPVYLECQMPLQSRGPSGHDFLISAKLVSVIDRALRHAIDDFPVSQNHRVVDFW